MREAEKKFHANSCDELILLCEGTQAKLVFWKAENVLTIL